MFWTETEKARRGRNRIQSVRKPHSEGNMRQGQNSKRPRGRGGNRRNVPTRHQTFDSNGPSVRIRGSAFQVHEKYLAMARDAGTSGDRVAAENFLQHAEHYFRIINIDNEASGKGRGQGNGAGGGDRKSGNGHDGAEQREQQADTTVDETAKPVAEMEQPVAEMEQPEVRVTSTAAEPVPAEETPDTDKQSGD